MPTTTEYDQRQDRIAALLENTIKVLGPDLVGNPDLQEILNRMVDQQIAGRGIRDQRVLDAMRIVPREKFMSEDLAEFAYYDTALPIEEDQTISQPYMVARMVEVLELKPDDRVLEIGSGSGYHAAVMSRLAHEVYTV